MARNLAPPPTPATLVPISLVLLLFFGILGADYILERFALGDPDWPALMRTLPLEAVWLKVAWAMTVWLGVAAAFFLLIRDNASVLLFFAAMIAALVLSAGLYATPAAATALPMGAVLATLVIVPGLGWIYARALNRKHLLH
ncbi:hypothetical protein [Pararhodobacter oceanensis]|uniref:Sugar transporter n=1 Tax=Pararhodobacter oceanensis TaxID=2172121 RepID=A0A2T8HYU6_9RHOB|nr:hypothetical protein [Pararhodobacter oceanensis]PVH30594.1 hypothetical protein DDE20_03470 [Pararhodobacter oceanensis]